MFAKATIVFVRRRDIVPGRMHVLLGCKTLQASYGAGKIVPPGGKLEDGESYEACVVREGFEEVGIALNPNDLMHVANLYTYLDGEERFFVKVYVTDIYTGEPAPSAEMVPDWYDIAELPFEQMLDGDREWVPGILSDERWNVTVCRRSDPNETWQVIKTPFGA